MKKNPPPKYKIVYIGNGWKVIYPFGTVPNQNFVWYWTACAHAWDDYYQKADERLAKELAE